MQSVRISDGIHWVGAIDWDLRDFHGYETPRGGTYNAYVVQGTDGIALIDTVKTPFVPELLSRIATVVPLSSITHIVVNHIEPDHNSGLPAAMAAMPQATVVASSAGARGIAEYHNGLEVGVVGADDVIDLGGRTLRFLPQPMLHWPDSMFTYCAEDCVLMPNDAFGQHLASNERFADEAGEIAWEELRTYYANILMPLDRQVGTAIDKITELGWACNVIAPSHGVCFRGDDIPRLIAQYQRWSACTTEPKIVIAYTTMWGSTETMAFAVADGISEAGVHVEVYNLADTALSAITDDLLEARAFLLGSPTLHRGQLYRSAGYLQYLAGLKPKDKIAGVFGSYGWSSGATKQMAAALEGIGFEMPIEDFTLKYRPTAEDLDEARAWGAKFAQAVSAGG